MFRNYLMTALRNLARNRLYAGVTILGLTIGFTVAILIAVFVRFETSYDRFYLGGERVYRMYSEDQMGKGEWNRFPTVFPSVAAGLKADFAQFEQVARVIVGAPIRVRRGAVEGTEDGLIFADPAFFRIFPLPVVAGDLQAALEQPSGVVLTRSQARKYFGTDRPIGQTLQLDGHPAEVRAVIEDLPKDTHLSFTMAMSGHNAFAEAVNDPYNAAVTVYGRLKPGADISPVQAAMPEFLERRGAMARMRAIMSTLNPGMVMKMTLGFEPLSDIHVAELKLKPLLWGLSAVGGLILLVAAINFVTLMTARAGRRAIEVGVRKVAGAGRRALVAQFMGEAFVYVGLSWLAALALAEMLLPVFNILTARGIPLKALHDWRLIAGTGAGALAVGLLAGAYPALVLSSFKPASVLTGGPIAGSSNGRLREIMVVVQFSILIGLVLCAATIYRQTVFSVRDALRVDAGSVYVVRGGCTEAVRSEVAKLPGVASASCSSGQIFNPSGALLSRVIDGRTATLRIVRVGPQFFETYGVKPLAGRVFDPARASDLIGAFQPGASMVISQTAMRAMGFSRPEQVVGRQTGGMNVNTIIGVVPDFAFASTRDDLPPVVYFAEPVGRALHVKMTGQDTAGAIKAIGRIGDRAGVIVVREGFLSQIMQDSYEAETLQATLLAIAAIIALVIAAMGLFALSAYTTERRTKEIGVRKAMGARSADVLRLLITQFARPIVIANLIAWPLAWLAMNRWLRGFSYRIDQTPWLYLAVGGGAVLIALATVLAHALKVARAKPVTALRYE